MSSNDDNDKMIDELNRLQKFKNRPCVSLALAFSAPGHAELQQSSNRQEDMRASSYSNHKCDLVSVTRYSCVRCGTGWEYEHHKANQKAGWSVVGG